MSRVRTIERATVEKVRVIDLDPDLTIDIELLYALCEVKGYSGLVNITDWALCDRLEAGQYIHTNPKGLSRASDKLKTIASEENLIFKE